MHYWLLGAISESLCDCWRPVFLSTSMMCGWHGYKGTTPNNCTTPLLYGAETWTITKRLTKRIDAFEMWTYRWMLRISWKEHKPNEEVLNMMKTSLKLMKIIKKRQCKYFGHFIRRPNSIQSLLLEARIDGKRGRGRPRTMWIDNIKDWLNLIYKECIRNAENREKWRSITFNLLRADETWWWWNGLI